MWRLEHVSDEELQLNAKARRGSAADSMFSTESIGGVTCGCGLVLGLCNESLTVLALAIIFYLRVVQCNLYVQI